MQRIVLIGNCQVQALYNLYLRYAAKSRSEHLTYIRAYEDITKEGGAAIAEADVIVEQVLDFKPKADIAGIETKAERIGVPVVNCGFLWPFAGQPHPNNPSPPYMESGPYARNRAMRS